jgi:hypothetical protein
MPHPGARRHLGSIRPPGRPIRHGKTFRTEPHLDELLATPFRHRYERSLGLALEAQIEECADYLQHPGVLVAEFLESYYLVEGKLDPERHDAQLEATTAELVLEPFYDSLELRIHHGHEVETIRCMAGAFAPLPGELHPALEHKGVDYVAVREGSQRIVLGVTEATAEASAFSLLLRGLNCLAELAPPFQLARLRRHVLRNRVDPDPAFDLQIGIAGRERAPLEASLLELCRDLAEIFKARVGAEAQFEGSVGRIECLELGTGPSSPSPSLRVYWRA